MKNFESGDYHEKFSDYYIFIKVIGKGSFGTVVKAIDKNSNQRTAVKVLCKGSIKPTHVSNLREEAKILSTLSHKNIISLHHFKETDRRIFISMELFRGMTLRTYMNKYHISEKKARLIITEILEGVNHLHSKGIIHRDLKPENILISKKSPLEVKIADFGLSASVGECLMEKAQCGTLLFMAPEQFSGNYYNKSIDIWSCGIILYMLLSKGKHPLSSTNRKEFIKKLMSPQWTFPDTFPSNAKSLFLQLVAFNPLDRYTASQALVHPWITNTKRKVPLTMLEEFKKYSDVLKLKTILYSLVFSSAICPKKEPSFSKPRTVNLNKRGKGIFRIKSCYFKPGNRIKSKIKNNVF